MYRRRATWFTHAHSRKGIPHGAKLAFGIAKRSLERSHEQRARRCRRREKTVDDHRQENAAPSTAPTPDAPADAPFAGEIAELQAHIGALETATATLHEQLLATSGVIKTLAEQNTQLIARIEATRRRVLWLTVVTGASALIAASSLLLNLLH